MSLEIFVFVASLIFALKGWIDWYTDLFAVNRLRDLTRPRIVLFVIPIVALALLVSVLAKLSALTVRDDPFYLYFGLYILLGAAWVGGATLIFPLLGICARDDVLERSNISAIWPIAGALLGISCSFAGANIGNGPGIDAVLLSALLSSALFFALWFGADVLTSISERITVERDEAAGIRMGGFLLGIGLLGGWSVAGDWISASATLKDFVLSSWPAIVLTAIAVFVESIFRLTNRKLPKVVPAFISVFYISAAIYWVAARGFH